MNEACIEFAVALKEIFPHYELAVLNDINDVDEDEVDEDYCYFNFVHAFCVDPKTSRRIIDALGIRYIKDLYDYFHDINPEIYFDILNTKYLIDNYSGKEFCSKETFEFSNELYREAKDFILENKQYYQIE